MTSTFECNEAQVTVEDDGSVVVWRRWYGAQDLSEAAAALKVDPDEFEAEVLRALAAHRGLATEEGSR